MLASIALAAVVAAGASDGLYLSRDSGRQFEQLLGRRQVLAQTFDLDGEHLLFSAHDGSPKLMRIKLQVGAVPQALAGMISNDPNVRRKPGVRSARIFRMPPSSIITYSRIPQSPPAITMRIV